MFNRILVSNHYSKESGYALPLACILVENTPKQIDFGYIYILQLALWVKINCIGQDESRDMKIVTLEVVCNHGLIPVITLNQTR